jgi:hypothetical protein
MGELAHADSRSATRVASHMKDNQVRDLQGDLTSRQYCRQATAHNQDSLYRRFQVKFHQ